REVPPTSAPAPAPEPAASTTTAPSPLPLARFETYRFEGFVKPDGTAYHAAVAPGDPVRGTFTIDFESPVYHDGVNVRVYQALANIQGTVGAYPFQGRQNL